MAFNQITYIPSYVRDAGPGAEGAAANLAGWSWQLRVNGSFLGDGSLGERLDVSEPQVSSAAARRT